MVHPISSVPAYDPGGSPWDLLKPGSELAKPSAPVEQANVKRPSSSPAPAVVAPPPANVVAAPPPNVVAPPVASAVAEPINREDGDLVAFLAGSLFGSKEPPAASDVIFDNRSVAPAKSPSPPPVAEERTPVDTASPGAASPPLADEEPVSIDEDLLTEQPAIPPAASPPPLAEEPVSAAVAPLAEQPGPAVSPSASPLPAAPDKSHQRHYEPATPPLTAPMHSVPSRPQVETAPPARRGSHRLGWLAVAALMVAGLCVAFGAARSWRAASPPAVAPAEAALPEPPPLEQPKAVAPTAQPAASAAPAASVSEADAGGAPAPSAGGGEEAVTLVTLTVSPPEAMISRPGDEPRRSPAVYQLDKGEKVVVSVSCWGYLSRTVVLDGSSPDVTVTLTRAPGAPAKAGKGDQARAASSKQNPVPTRKFDPLP